MFKSTADTSSLPVQPFSYIKSSININNQHITDTRATNNLTFNIKSPKSIVYSQGFVGCAGILSIAKNTNNNFDIQLSHFIPLTIDPAFGKTFFNDEVKPHLNNIPANAKVIVFLQGEWGKLKFIKQKLKSNQTSNEIISRIKKEILTHDIRIHNYYYDWQDFAKGKPSNAIAAVFDPQENNVKVYTEGNNQNPYKEILTVK